MYICTVATGRDGHRKISIQGNILYRYPLKSRVEKKRPESKNNVVRLVATSHYNTLLCLRCYNTQTQRMCN